MGRVVAIFTQISDKSGRVWALEQEEAAERAIIFESQLTQKKYSRHDGLVEWLRGLPSEGGPYTPPFDIFISTFKNKKGIQSVQRIGISLPPTGHRAAPRPRQRMEQASMKQGDTQPIRAQRASRGLRILQLLMLLIVLAVVIVLGFAMGSGMDFRSSARAIVGTGIAALPESVSSMPIVELPRRWAAPVAEATAISPRPRGAAAAKATSIPPNRAAAVVATDIPPTATSAPPTRTPVPPTATGRPSSAAQPAACYGGERVWILGAMNVRAAPSVDAAKSYVAQPGQDFAVLESQQRSSYCWLRIDRGWMAWTANVSRSKPAPTAVPVVHTGSSSGNTGGGASSGGAAASDVQQALARLNGLTVAAEHRCSPYNSNDYSYPQSVEPRIVRQMGGHIYGPYTGRHFSSMRETDIEHIVAKAEAHDSGLCRVGVDARRSFARDLLNLTLASPSVNRHQKSAKDFAEWQPARNVCWFADRIIRVKERYRLTVDSREKAALQRALENCSTVSMQ